MRKRIDNKVLITGLIVLGVVVIVFGILSSLQSASGYNTITSYGEGSIETMPDFVTVYFNVQTQSVTADEASDKNAQIVVDMTNAFIALGFSEDDIKTSGFSVYPNYDYSGRDQRITGYTATHSINTKLEIEEKALIGEVIDAGVGSGAGINYIGYELTKENQNKFKAQAIEIAAQDARVKAESLASGAGKSLGKIVSLSTDEGYYGGPWIAYSAEARDSSDSVSGAEIATSITPSEQEISARVTVVYEIR
ncbi:MAG: SIMPL domain-containing protein [Nanoarchaeota archaeon]|nr:SIMPL domain-containing protein [Nanoarchaeota archaeon]